MDHKDSDLKLISEQPLSSCLGSASTTSSTSSTSSTSTTSTTPSTSSNALVAANGAFQSNSSTVPTSIAIPMGDKEYKQEQTSKVDKACFDNTDTTDSSVATTNKADTPDTASTSILQDGNAMLAPLPLASCDSGVYTGGDTNTCQLIGELRHCIRTASSIDIIVSFLMESGVRSIIADLRFALENHAHIRLLSGTYLGITSPYALSLLWDEFNEYLGQGLEIHLYQDPKRSFHAKAYMFHYPNGASCMFIGSSNLSRSALTSGIEWNYRFSNNIDDQAIIEFTNSFADLFDHESSPLSPKLIAEYSASWRRPTILSRYMPQDDDDNVSAIVTPRGAQIEALSALERTRESGSTKGLIVAATGVGKTYLAAFDSQTFTKVLFVAHREEILKQAATSFIRVRGCPKSDIGFFNGEVKDTTKPLIFAGVQTLGQKDKLQPKYFAPDYFDYIVIDEFHHAAASSYQNILNYFKPQFLLGLTATPDRLDGKSIYALTEHNVPFSIDLFTAINHGLLVPFHYYAVYDYTVDYETIKTKPNGEYLEADLETNLSIQKRHELVFKSCDKYPGKRTIGFCVSRKHAIESALYFTTHGVMAVAVVSNASNCEALSKTLGNDSGSASRDASRTKATNFKQNTSNHNVILDRSEAIKRLRDPSDPLSVIFCVDMFNEGVDIPEIDKVLLLRPTESPVIFFQQLGRGLRLAPNYPQKQYLNVIDFIGNYKHAGLCFSLLGHLNQTQNENLDWSFANESNSNESASTGDDATPNNPNGLDPTSTSSSNTTQGPSQTRGSQTKANDDDFKHPLKDYEYPDGCFVDVDLKLIDLIKEIDAQKRKAPLKPSVLKDEYLRIKEALGVSQLSRYQYLVNLDDKVFKTFYPKKKYWPLNNWLAFRQHIINDLSAKEEQCLLSPISQLFTQLEREHFTRSYKLPVLMSLVEYNLEGLKITTNTQETSQNQVVQSSQGMQPSLTQGIPMRLKNSVGLDEILVAFRKFYANSFYQQDLGSKEIIEKCKHFAKTTPEDFKKLVLNQPIKYLCTKTGHKESLFRYDAPTQTLILNEFLSPYLNDEIVAREYADICQSAVYLYFKKRYQEAAANDA